MTTTLERMMSKDPSVKALELLFRRVPYGIEVVWVDNGPEVYGILYPLSKQNGDWLWGGEAMPKWHDGSATPTFQYGTFRMWSRDRGKLMVATKKPDTDRLRKWVGSIVS